MHTVLLFSNGACSIIKVIKNTHTFSLSLSLYNDMNYMIEVYTGGSKSEKGVGSGIAIFIDGSLTFQLWYKFVEKCSNNQAEQLAIAKALGKVRDLHQLQSNQ